MVKKNNHTSTLFHYTRSRATLLSILKNGFKFGFCEEDFQGDMFVAYPMVCFCDIPIIDSEEHSLRYGKYAIGLSKESMIRLYPHNLGPVNYVLSQSFINSAFILKELAKKYDKELAELINSAEEQEKIEQTFLGSKWVGIGLNATEGKKTMFKFQDALKYHHASTKAISLMKPYASIVKGKVVINYNECEWRMVLPEHVKVDGMDDVDWFWDKKDYHEWCNSRKNRLVDVTSLTFNTSEINHLIVPKDKDIPPVVNAISKMKILCGNPLSYDDKAMLVSKIISYEQIRNNF